MTHKGASSRTSNGTCRYVVARAPNAGIGDHLSCLLGAWWYAKRTGRALVVDWRGSRFNSRFGHNCFFDYFERVREIDGVPVFADDDVAEILGSGPFFFPKWSPESVGATHHVGHSREEMSAIYALVETGVQRPEPVVIINQHLPLPRDRSGLARALLSLRFQPRFSERADLFLRSVVGESPVVGVHIRHGNGENIGDRVMYWLDPVDLFRQLRENRRTDIHRAGAHGAFRDNMPPSLMAVRRNTRAERALYRNVGRHFIRLKRALPGQSKLLLFTDSMQVVDGLRQVIPDVTRYDATLIPIGDGPLHKVSDKGVVVSSLIDDMLIELSILRRCAALIYMPSQFTVLSRAALPEDCLVSLRPSLTSRLVKRFACAVPP